MNTRKSQWLSRLTALIICLLIGLAPLHHQAFAVGTDTHGTPPKAETSSESDPKEAENAFNDAVSSFSESDARLGDELAMLPGPNVSLSTLLQALIFWSASLASSVALVLVMIASFRAIGGSEEAHNNQKRAWLQAFIGIALVLFSFQIVSIIMGILWAT